jgi:fumarate hydratase class II
MEQHHRIERDSMGEVRVPRDSLYGAQTARAVENFRISNMRLQRPYLRALGLIKASAARVNGQKGYLSPAKAFAIEAAANAVAEGMHDDAFVVDVFQTGSGTSTNMNTNEVIGRLAGAHPNDEVNRGQSSNDVIPTALHMAAVEAVRDQLLPAMSELQEVLEAKTRQFHDVIKIGRTHLQDAVPIRLGQEFSGYARQVELSRQRVEAALPGMCELALGGTAVGSGLNAPAGFAAAVIAELACRTRLPFREAANHFEAQGARDAAAFLSASLRNYALSLIKIANDVRWLGSGPRCGIGELHIPATQPGSSMMPGKVNPVIAESLLMVCAQVIGHDSAIAWCAAAGNFELNAMMPLIAWNLLDSIELLTAGTRNFAVRLVQGLGANRERAAAFVEQSLGVATALVPVIGYDQAAELVAEASASGRSIRDVALERSGVSVSELDRLLDPRGLT